MVANPGPAGANIKTGKSRNCVNSHPGWRIKAMRKEGCAHARQQLAATDRNVAHADMPYMTNR